MNSVTLNPNFIIKQLRLGHYLTQQDLADAIGVSRPKYNCYERNGYNINIQRLTRIAQFYNISLDCISGAFMNYKPFYPDLELEDTEAHRCFLQKKIVIMKYGNANAKDVFNNIPFTE